MPSAFTRTLWLIMSLVFALGSTGTGMAQHNRHDPRVLREDPRLAEGQIAPVLEGLGEHSLQVTTTSKRAQLFFDQSPSARAFGLPMASTIPFLSQREFQRGLSTDGTWVTSQIRSRSFESKVRSNTGRGGGW